MQHDAVRGATRREAVGLLVEGRRYLEHALSNWGCHNCRLPVVGGGRGVVRRAGLVSGGDTRDRLGCMLAGSRAWPPQASILLAAVQAAGQHGSCYGFAAAGGVGCAARAAARRAAIWNPILVIGMVVYAMSGRTARGDSAALLSRATRLGRVAGPAGSSGVRIRTRV